jgi:hypothetical protein
MGTQQLIFLVLGTIIVAIAITVGIGAFRSYHTESIGDQMQSTLTMLATEAKAHFLKPKTLGGGGGSFDGFSLPKGVNNSADIVYDVTHTATQGQARLTLKAKAKDGTIMVILGHMHDSFEAVWGATGAYASRRKLGQPF